MTRAQSETSAIASYVNAPLERAFRVFTEQFGDFKPREHNLLSVPIAETVFEPRVGGHIYDRGVDGRLCKWARIMAYEPPSRVVFTWDIGPTWQLETDLTPAPVGISRSVPSSVSSVAITDPVADISPYSRLASWHPTSTPQSRSVGEFRWHIGYRHE